MKKIFSLFAAILFVGSMMAATVEIYKNEGTTETIKGITASGNVNTNEKNGNPGNSFANTSSSNTTFTFAGFDVAAYSNLKLSLDAKFGSFPSTTETWPHLEVVFYKGEEEVLKDETTVAWSEKNNTYSTYVINITGDFDKIVCIGHPAEGKSGKGNPTTNYAIYFDNFTVTGEGGADIDATDIELNKTELNLVEGESETLVATLTPSDATTTVVWESSNEAVATVSSNGKVTAVAPGSAIIKATAGSVFAACDVTVTAAPLMTCAEAAALAKDEIAKMGEVIVSCVAGSNIYIKDATGYALIYKKDFGLLAGDVVNGFIGKSSPYNGLPELIPTVTLSDLDVVHGDAPAPEELTAAPTTADINRYVIIKGVKFATATFDNKNITAILNEEEFVVRNNFNLDIAFDTNKKYDIVGAGAIYNTTLQLYLINATESSTTAIDNTNDEVKTIKRIENGQLVIIKNGVRYNALGAQF